MNNHDCICAVLAAHREARAWDDEAVARDLVAQLGLDPVGDAKNARPVVPAGLTEDEVVAHEAAAQQAVDKAKAAREALEAQKVADETHATDTAHVANQQSQGDEATRRLTEQRAAADAEVERQRSAQQRVAEQQRTAQQASQDAQARNREAATHDAGATKIGGGAVVF